MKNKFLYFVLFLIIIVVSAAIYIAIFEKGVDRNSYVELLEGTATLNEKELKLNERKKLEINDIVTTTSEDALAVIEWWDGSVTRLWGNTSIQIHDLYVSKNREQLNISFELFKWKTWSNVMSFITDESNFTQTFMDMEAAVRGTTFNVDLDNNYLYVIDNNVELTRSDGKSVDIEENRPFNLKTFSFIDLVEFIKSFKDSAFEKINMAMDSELYARLVRELQTQIDSLKRLSDTSYDYLLKRYQELHFVSSESKELYDLRIALKQKLIQVAPKEEETQWLNSLVNDLRYTLKIQNYDVAKNVLNVLIENKNAMTADMQNTINSAIGGINNSSLLNEFQKAWDSAAKFFMQNSINFVNSVKNDSFFQSLFWTLKENFKALFPYLFN